MYCSYCGNQIPDNAQFCSFCGAAAGTQTGFEASLPAGNGEVRMGIPAPGFSDRVNHPEILAAVKRNRGAAKVFLFFLLLAPPVGFAVYSKVTGEMELNDALKYGAVISGVFLLFAIFSFIKESAKHSYEGVVTDKRSRLVSRDKSSGDRGLMREYTTYVRTSSGKKKKIKEREGSQIWAYNYLNVGDRFMYHPQFHFPYELYDKSSAPYICCVSCGTKNNVQADRCERCCLPLLK